jgi:hypothetical protein
MTGFYRTSPTKQQRRSKQEITVIEQGLKDVLTTYHPMTVRQVFYQMSTRGYIAKTEREYKQTVCRLLARLRLRQEIPFGWIADDTRWMRKPTTYDSMEAALKLNVQTYRRALWARMPVNVEVWIEKDALAGVVYDITAEWDVPLMVTRGYPSLTYVYEAAEALSQSHKPTYIYYLGDYDPSGVDISRGLEARLRSFAPDAVIEFRRIAVEPYQIRIFDLPSRPTKTSDSRAKRFNSDISVELDALPPDILRDLVKRSILGHVNSDELARLRQIEAAERESLEWVVNNLKLDGSVKYHMEEEDMDEDKE